MDAPTPPRGEPRDGVDLLLALAGEDAGPALILAALLLAQGERAALTKASGRPYVRVQIEPRDLARLPPYAQPIVAGGRFYVPLDPRHARATLGLLPREACESLAESPPPAVSLLAGRRLQGSA